QQHLPDCWREDVFNGINDFLAAILNDASQPDPIAMAITDAIIRQSESLQLQTLADELDVSVRQMQRRFRNATGLTCKQFQQIRRFRMALAELVIPERKDSSVIALDAGFFDQSHLINQVRSYMDLTVQQFQEKHDEITRQDILP
ncbi:MAG: helix-turn-helix domain-containing protein, partial [Planctomycetota bacterium]